MQSMKKDGANFAESILEQGHDKYEQLKSQSFHYIKMLEEEVVAKPAQSMAIAVGAGMVLSYLLRRA